MSYICLQEDNRDCGRACLKMMIATIQKNRKFLNINIDLKKNCSMLDMKKQAEKYKVNLEGLEVTNFTEIFKYKNFIAQLKINERMHFVFVIKVGKKRVKMIDPSYGETIISLDDFKQFFTNYILVHKTHQKYELPKEKIFCSISCIVAYIATFIIDYGLLYLISFIIKDAQYLLLILLSCLGLIMSFVSKTLIINLNYHIIDNKIKKILNKKINDNEFNLLMNIKTKTTTYIYGVINAILTSIFICFILVVNEILNLILILVILMIVLIKEIIGREFILNKEYKLILQEEDIVNNQKFDAENYVKLNKEINKVIENKVMMKSLVYSLSIFFVASLNYFNEFNSLAYMLFTTTCYLVLFERVDTFVLLMNKDKNEYNRSINAFYRIKE